MTYYDYLIVGAGPGGVQMGYFLEQAGRNYLILEGGHQGAMFFSHKPRHRRLNSFNKRFNWFPEPEYNLRFDWNSLLTHDYSFQFRNYTKELYPLADTVVKYINDFAQHFGINIQFDTRITHIARDPETKVFILTASNGDEYRCRVLIMATGPVKPVIPEIEGVEHVEGYEHHDTDLERFEGKRVIILGHGNAAFETANHLANSAALITIVTRNKWLKHAWQTHYVGDVRAAGNAILDMSQLKLLHSVQGINPTKVTKEPDGTLRLYYTEEFPHWTTPGVAAGWLPADYIIRCTGWKYLVPELFDPDIQPAPSDASGKYPMLSSVWESSVPDLYYAGAAMEGRNRRSPTGFIHGYRYAVRALFRTLEDRYEGVQTPHETFELKNAANLQVLTERLIKRLSLTSGLYEAYGILADALVFDRENGKAELFYEMPADHFLEHPYFMGKTIIVLTLEYGFNNFPGANPDSFVRRNDPERPGCVGFIHPVFRQYDRGVFVKGRNTRSSVTIRYDKESIDFDGDVNLDKPFNILRNFINTIAQVTPEVYPEDHFYNDAERGGFQPWTEQKPLDDPGLPQCALTVGGTQVRNFDHLERLEHEAGKPVPPWIHTM